MFRFVEDLIEEEYLAEWICTRCDEVNNPINYDDLTVDDLRASECDFCGHYRFELPIVTFFYSSW